MQNNNRAQDSAQERPQRAAIYLRVSTQYQVDKDSLPMQRQELEAYCDLVLNIKDHVIFEDAGYSGKNTDRPAYQEMMYEIREGLFTHLVVWKIDRISRNLLDFASMYDELKRLDVTFVSKNEQFDTSTAMGEAMLKIILVFAELERGMTSERVTATMINRASNGVWNGGRVPFGYDYDKGSRTFSLNEQESAIVKRMFDLYDDRPSIVRTCQKLNAEGYRSRAGNEFSPVSVETILRNPWYKGTYRYNYYKIPGRKAIKDSSEWVIVDGHHVPIVDAEQFDRVQKTLDNNCRYLNKPGQRIERKNVHVFAGLIWCADCGCAFNASPGKVHASGWRASEYHCPSAPKNNNCSTKYVSDTAVGEFLINYILNIMNAQRDFSEIDSPAELERRLLRGSTFKDIASIEPDGLNLLYDMLSKYTSSDSVLLSKPKSKPKIDPELRRLRNEQKKQERALERLNNIYLYSEKSMSEREYVVRKQEITDALQEINEAIGLASQEPWAKTMSDEDFLSQASSFILNRELQDRSYIYYQRLAEETDPHVLKDFFNSVIASVWMRDTHIESIVFKNGLTHTFVYWYENPEK